MKISLPAVAPSLLAANVECIEKELKTAEEAGCHFLHFDVMDGRFVPNTSFSLSFFEKIKNLHTMINDVHIMVSDPLTEGVAYAEAGADIVTFHYEACKDNEERMAVIEAIRKAGSNVGMSIKPSTPAEDALSLLPHLDLILVMSVEPGKGGQSFLPSAVDKITLLRKTIDEAGLNTLIEVDGGINETTGLLVKKAGADLLVAGSYLFGHEDFALRVKKLVND